MIRTLAGVELWVRYLVCGALTWVVKYSGFMSERVCGRLGRIWTLSCSFLLVQVFRSGLRILLFSTGLGFQLQMFGTSRLSPLPRERSVRTHVVFRCSPNF